MNQECAVKCDCIIPTYVSGDSRNENRWMLACFKLIIIHYYYLAYMLTRHVHVAHLVNYNNHVALAAIITNSSLRWQSF